MLLASKVNEFVMLWLIGGYIGFVSSFQQTDKTDHTALKTCTYNQLEELLQ